MRAVLSAPLRALLIVGLGASALLITSGVLMAADTLFATFGVIAPDGRGYQYLFAVHLAVGLALVLPLAIYLAGHAARARGHQNSAAIARGRQLAVGAVVMTVSGLALTRGLVPLEHPNARQLMYWLHLVAGFGAIVLYVRHRRMGRRLNARLGRWVGSAATVAVLVIAATYWPTGPDPVDPPVLEPSLAKTVGGQPIPASVMMQDDRCAECHTDTHARWAASAHRFASFNNPAYLASVRSTREFLRRATGSTQGVRFCAGCHDIVPLVSGRLDDPNFDDVNDPTATAGVNCLACHAIQSVDSARGNSDVTWGAPAKYPFADSESELLRSINAALIKANPTLHKRSMLKPLHQTAEFCGACHKVHIPKAVNNYRWLRGQNHYDSFLLSGVSGRGASSFYYPDSPQQSCNGCHMPPTPSEDLGARPEGADGELVVHDHYFAGGNSALPQLVGTAGWSIDAQREALRDVVGVDIFALRTGQDIDGKLLAPLDDGSVTIDPGADYLLEVVIRNRKAGHLLTEGTADSNQLWLELLVDVDGEPHFASGLIGDEGRVDANAHFLNRYVLDREGKKIDRRNVEDIFVALYDNQIPPGATGTVRYALSIPEDAKRSIAVSARVRYRKFDRTFQSAFATTDQHRDALPILELGAQRLELSVSNEPTNDGEAKPAEGAPQWVRWNDYGIGLLRQRESGSLRQARQAFEQVERLGSPHGSVNLARVAIQEGDLSGATRALQRAVENGFEYPWVADGLSAEVNFENGFFAESIAQLTRILDTDYEDARSRGFDFSRDYRIRERLGLAWLEWAKQARGDAQSSVRQERLRAAAEAFRAVLAEDPERAATHYALSQAMQALGDRDAAAEHLALHGRYRTDDRARGRAISLARRRDPAANNAAESPAIYPLSRSQP